MASATYTPEQQAEFCALAQEIGIGRAIRELGYPKSYPTGIKWMNARGIKPNIDKIMQQAKLWHTFYETEDLLEQIDTAIAICNELILNVTDADSMKKLAESLQKLVNTRQVLEGKATSISEKRETTPLDAEIANLMEQQKRANEERMQERL